MGCCQTRRRHEELTVQFLVLGLEGAGKSSLISSLEGKPFDEFIEPNTSTSIKEFKKDGHLIRTIEYGKPKGAERQWHKVYDYFKYDAIILVVDGSDYSRYEEVEHELKELLQSRYEPLEHLPIALFVNKTDKRVKIDTKELTNIIKDTVGESRAFGEVYFMSAKTGKNVTKSFKLLFKHIKPLCSRSHALREKQAKLNLSSRSTPSQMDSPRSLSRRSSAKAEDVNSH